MNIFVLDLDPRKCAEYHCDKHVVKMILEYAQLMSTAHHELQSLTTITDNIYKRTHVNHPCSVWVRKSSVNYEWLFDLWDNLLQEYYLRYNKDHKSGELFDYLLHIPKYINQSTQRSPFVLCMPEQYKVSNDPVESYRNYYMSKTFANWNRSIVPQWYKEKSRNETQ